MLTLYQFEISPFCDKIRRVLDYKRIPYEIHEVGMIEAQTSYRRLNPVGKCPALADGEGRIVGDSTDIAYWLEERYPDPPLLPRDSHERALAHVFEDWADESLYFYEMRLRFGLPHNRTRTLPRLLEHEGAVMKTILPLFLPRAIQGQMNAQGVGRKSDEQVLHDVRRHLDALEALLVGREYLVGRELSLADVAVFCMLSCIRDAAEGAADIERRASVGAFMERIDQATRPGMPETAQAG